MFTNKKWFEILTFIVAGLVGGSLMFFIVFGVMTERYFLVAAALLYIPFYIFSGWQFWHIRENYRREQLRELYDRDKPRN